MVLTHTARPASVEPLHMPGIRDPVEESRGDMAAAHMIALTNAGAAHMVVRTARPYRLLSPSDVGLDEETTCPQLGRLVGAWSAHRQVPGPCGRPTGGGHGPVSAVRRSVTWHTP